MSATPPSSGCGGLGSGGSSGGISQGPVVPSVAPLPPSSSSIVPSVSGIAAPTSVGSASSADHFCLRWNNYQTNMTTVFDQLLQEEVRVNAFLF